MGLLCFKKEKRVATNLLKYGLVVLYFEVLKNGF